MHAIVEWVIFWCLLGFYALVPVIVILFAIHVFTKIADWITGDF